MISIIVSDDEAGVICEARMNDGERRVTSLRLDDEHAGQTMRGLAVLSGCLAAILQDVAQNNQTMRQAADHYTEGDAP